MKVIEAAAVASRMGAYIFYLHQFYFMQFLTIMQAQNNRNANTIVIINNVKFRDLENLIHFMYNGEVKVATNQELQGFLQAGELLEIEGLTKCTVSGQK
jgi:hypothetical protein